MALFSDHQKVGKKFVPLPVAQNWSQLDFPDSILPELVWIAYLQVRWGNIEGTELAVSLIEFANEQASVRPIPDCSFLSAHLMLTEADRVRVQARLEGSGRLAPVREALLPFLRCYPKDNALAYLWPATTWGDPSPADIELTRKLLGSRLSRWSGPGTAMQAVVLLAELKTGRLHLPVDLPRFDLNSILAAPNSAAAKEAGGFVRTTVSSSYAFHQERLGPAWARYFWQRGCELESVGDLLTMPDPPLPTDHVLIRFRKDFARMAIEGLKVLSPQIMAALGTEEEHAVINGLLARQATLAIGVADDFEIWNWDIGPLYLRAMTDCYITLAWILGDTLQRSREYIMHGLGQEKLWIAHQEEELARLTDAEDKKTLQQMVDISKAWIESQKFLFLVTVNLGSWSGKSTRQMAVEADCLGLYNFAYLPYSFNAHSTWNHVGKFNSVPTRNPLHQNIRVPHIPSYGGELSIAGNAAKYLDKSFTAVITRFSFSPLALSPLAWTNSRMEQVWRELNKETATANVSDSHQDQSPSTSLP